MYQSNVKCLVGTTFHTTHLNGGTSVVLLLTYCYIRPDNDLVVLKKNVARWKTSFSIGTTTLSWVSACSTVLEHSQQEGFTECRCQRHVKPPTWRRTRNLERSNFRHKRPTASEATLVNPAVEGGTKGEKWPRIFAESGDFHVTFGFFYMPQSTTWDRRLYFPSEGRRAEDFFARKIRRLRPGLNPRTWVRYL
jgi:hypothetical protein